jgi:multicomponent Na+:H+ antiporter subunit D
LVLFPVFAGTVLLLLHRKALRISVLFVQAAMLIGAAYLFFSVKQDGAVTYAIGGWPAGMGIALYADLFVAVFALMICVLFFCCIVYQLSERRGESRLFFLITVLEGLTLGIFLSRDLFNIFVLIEVATVVISLLIMYQKDRIAIYDGIMYLLVNAVAMSFFLLGIGMIYTTFGTLDLVLLRQALAALPNGGPVVLAYSFMITAVCLKSALMPLFSWLPRAHATPSAPVPVSAILSGIYVKSGIFLFMRLQDAFAPVFDLSDVFLVLGFLTAVIGFLLAIAQKDIKLILAYHTISQIGMIMMGLCMKSTVAEIGAVYHIINHALFKSALFLTAGIIAKAYGTRNVYEIRGVFRNMPLIGTAMIIAVLGITGAPHFNGSISKYWIAYSAKDSWAQYGLMLVNLGTMISFVKYAQMLFQRQDIPQNTITLQKKAVTFFISLLCLLGGLFGKQVIEFMFEIEMPMDFNDYMQKAVHYVISLIAGVGLYRLVIKRIDLSALAKRAEIGFQGACVAIGVFLLALIGITSILT